MSSNPVSEQIVRQEISFDPRARRQIAELREFWASQGVKLNGLGPLVRYGLDLAHLELQTLKRMSPQDRQAARRQIVEAKKSREK